MEQIFTQCGLLSMALFICWNSISCGRSLKFTKSCCASDPYLMVYMRALCSTQDLRLTQTNTISREKRKLIMRNYLLKLLLILFPVAFLHMPFLGFGTAECDKALKTLQVFMLVWKKKVDVAEIMQNKVVGVFFEGA